ncbi:hypothetical protein HK405_000507, partial [Cladochytrium tenue]
THRNDIMPKKVFVVIHSLWGHVKSLADEVIIGLKSEGVDVTLYRVAETLPKEVLTKMYAKSFDDIPVITPDLLKEADGFIFGFGCHAFRFWDQTGQLWMAGALAGKYGGVFTSTATQHGGQETTILSFLSHYAHHGINFVPLGPTPEIGNIDEVLGGGPWGAGVIAGGQGQRQASAKELSIARAQGVNFGKTINKVK